MKMTIQDLYITRNAKGKAQKLKISEKDMLVILEYGNRSKARKNGFIHYIPKKLIKSNKVFEKYKNIYMIERKGVVIDIFKNSNFKVQK